MQVCTSLNCMRFLPAHFSSMSRSLWWLPNPPVYPPCLPVLYHLQNCWTLCPTTQIVNEDVKQDMIQYWPLTRLCTTDHHPLGLAVQFLTHLTVCSSTASLCLPCDGKQHQKPYWSLGKWYLLLSPLLQAHHFIIESFKVHHAQLLLGENMLTTPDHFLDLYCLKTV